MKFRLDPISKLGAASIRHQILVGLSFGPQTMNELCFYFPQYTRSQIRSAGDALIFEVDRLGESTASGYSVADTRYSLNARGRSDMKWIAYWCDVFF